MGATQEAVGEATGPVTSRRRGPVNSYVLSARCFGKAGGQWRIGQNRLLKHAADNLFTESTKLPIRQQNVGPPHEDLSYLAKRALRSGKLGT